MTFAWSGMPFAWGGGIILPSMATKLDLAKQRQKLKNLSKFKKKIFLHMLLVQNISIWYRRNIIFYFHGLIGLTITTYLNSVWKKHKKLKLKKNQKNQKTFLKNAKMQNCMPISIWYRINIIFNFHSLIALTITAYLNSV